MQTTNKKQKCLCTKFKKQQQQNTSLQAGFLFTKLFEHAITRCHTLLIFVSQFRTRTSEVLTSFPWDSVYLSDGATEESASNDVF